MENQKVPDSVQPSIASELAAIPYEPLLPVEKKLIAFSLILGIVLLGLLLWISTTFFPVSTAPAASSSRAAACDRPARRLPATSNHVDRSCSRRFTWRV
jgi:galactitol-specific phosphotransferase system IIC component